MEESHFSFKSNSLKHFTYDFSIGPFYELGDMGNVQAIIGLEIEMLF